MPRSPAITATSLPTVGQYLERHEGRRHQGLPTVSVLAGPSGLGMHHWRQWHQERQRSVVSVARADLEEIVRSWTAQVSRERDLAGDCCAWLAQRLGRPAPELRHALSLKTSHELEMFLSQVLPESSLRGVEALARWLLQQAAAGEPFAPEHIACQLNAVLASLEAPWTRVLVALHELLPSSKGPALLVAPLEPPADVPGWLESMAHLLTQLVSAVPALPVALAVATADLETYNQHARESRSKAILRETVIHLPTLDEGAIHNRLRNLGAPTEQDLAGSIQRLATDGASEELVRLFRDAAVQTSSVQEPEDRARSAAERFLFARLESLPDTAGLFQLNAQLGFRFGPTQEAEVDLVCRELALAIEIDGYYHFQDADAFRRDRRKDFELQKRGYLVLRFLAEDVVTRLEEVLSTILAGVSCRRSRSTGMK